MTLNNEKRKTMRKEKKIMKMINKRLHDRFLILPNFHKQVKNVRNKKECFKGEIKRSQKSIPEVFAEKENTKNKKVDRNKQQSSGERNHPICQVKWKRNSRTNVKKCESKVIKKYKTSKKSVAWLKMRH